MSRWLVSGALAATTTCLCWLYWVALLDAATRALVAIQR